MKSPCLLSSPPPFQLNTQPLFFPANKEVQILLFFAPSVVIPVSFKDPQAIKTLNIYTAYLFLDWFKSASLANRKCHNKIFISCIYLFLFQAMLERQMLWQSTCAEATRTCAFQVKSRGCRILKLGRCSCGFSFLVLVFVEPRFFATKVNKEFKERKSLTLIFFFFLSALSPFFAKQVTKLVQTQKKLNGLRWLNTVSRAVSGSAYFKLDQQTWRRKEQWYTDDDFSKSTH